MTLIGSPDGGCGRCCECQGIHCLIPHPGHSCREVVAENIGIGWAAGRASAIALAEEACAIAAHQQNGRVHPLTCGIDSTHAPLVPFVKEGRIFLRCLGSMIGFTPEPCSYEQQWNPLAGTNSTTSGIAGTAASPAQKDK